MYNGNNIVNLSFTLDKINKIKDDLINNYFFISDFLKEKKHKSIDRDSTEKIITIQSKLDIAMNFSISKIEFILLELRKKIKTNSSATNKISINDEFVSPGHIDEIENDFIAKTNSIEDAKFFSDLDFSDFESEKDRIENTINNSKRNADKSFQDEKNNINITPEEILFFGEKLNDIETKMRLDIDQLKMDSKFISEINDNLMLQMQNMSPKPGHDNSAYETNAFYLALEKNLGQIIAKIDDINTNMSSINILSEKIDRLTSKNPQTNDYSTQDENDFSNKIISLQRENDLYKRKFISSIEELEMLKRQSHEDNFHFKNNDDYLMNTSKKLENLEAIISNQISDFQDIEYERDELLKLFENKILDLKKKLNEKEIRLNELEFRNPANNSQNYDDKYLHSNNDYYSLLLKIEDKLNNLSTNFVNKNDFELAKLDNSKKSEEFSKIENDLKESYAKLDKFISVNDGHLYKDIHNTPIDTKPIKLENNEKNNIIKEQYFVDSDLENNLIEDLEVNINQLRQFERFLLDFNFEIDKFK